MLFTQLFKRGINVSVISFLPRLHFKVFKTFVFIMKGIQNRYVIYGKFISYKMFQSDIQINKLTVLYAAFI